MATNNSILADAAQAGFSAGVYAQAVDVGSQEGASYSDIASMAASFASAVDAKLAGDSTITSSGGQAIVPTDPSTIEAQLGKALLMYGICAAKAQAYAIGSLIASSIPAAAISDLADDVVGAYQAGQSQLATP